MSFGVNSICIARPACSNCLPKKLCDALCSGLAASYKIVGRLGGGGKPAFQDQSLIDLILQDLHG